MYSLQKSTRFALYALVDVVRLGGKPLTAADFAANHRVPPNHIAKVLQRLKSAGLLEAQRGAGGGYTLVRDPAEIRMFDVVEAFEGPLNTDCSLREDGDQCVAESCSIHGVLGDIELYALTKLQETTLAVLAWGELGPPDLRSGADFNRLPMRG